MEIIVSKLIELAKELGKQEIKAEFFEEKFHAADETIKTYIEQKSELQAQVFQLTAENAELKEQLAKLKESTQTKQYEKNIVVIPKDFILHYGGECPDFPDNCKIKAFTRNGSYFVSNPKELKWRHTNNYSDIIAYKIIED